MKGVVVGDDDSGEVVCACSIWRRIEVVTACSSGWLILVWLLWKQWNWRMVVDVDNEDGFGFFGFQSKKTGLNRTESVRSETNLLETETKLNWDLKTPTYYHIEKNNIKPEYNYSKARNMLSYITCFWSFITVTWCTQVKQSTSHSFNNIILKILIVIAELVTI